MNKAVWLLLLAAAGAFYWNQTRTTFKYGNYVNPTKGVSVRFPHNWREMHYAGLEFGAGTSATELCGVRYFPVLAPHEQKAVLAQISRAHGNQPQDSDYKTASVNNQEVYQLRQQGTMNGTPVMVFASTMLLKKHTLLLLCATLAERANEIESDFESVLNGVRRTD